MERFDDYLGLARRSFTGERLVVFTGRSGSGKSTAIEWLLGEHADFRGRARVVLRAPEFGEIARGSDVVVLDDLVEPREVLRAVRYLVRARTVIVASHLSIAWFQPLRAFGSLASFRTDADRGKIERYLESLGVRASRDAVRRFVRRFGATYTDVDLVLERYPSASFDASLAKFVKFCRIELAAARV